MRVVARGESAASNPLLEATPECIVVVGLDGRIEFANRRVADLTGFSPDDLQGRSLGGLISGGLSGLVANEPCERRCRRADGTEVPVEVRIGDADEAQGLLVVTLRGASDLHGEIQAKIEAEARLRAIVEQISAITYTWTWRDGQYFVVYTSLQIERILGYTPEEWIADPTAW